MTYHGRQSKQLLLLRLALAASFAVCIWRNAVHGSEIGAASRRHPTILTPATTAFSIWNAIYLFLLIFTLRECIAPSLSMPLDQLTWLYRLTILANVLNATWVELFTRDYVVVAGGILLLTWITLFALYMITVENVEPPHIVATLSLHRDPDTYPCTSTLDYLALRVPFTLYSSWLTGATLISIVITLSAWGVQLEMYMYIAALTVLLMIHIVALLWQGDVVYAAVGVWTLAWLEVASANKKVLVLEDPEKYAEITAIQVMATLGLSVIVALTVVLLVVRWYLRNATYYPILSAPNPPPTYGAI